MVIKYLKTKDMNSAIFEVTGTHKLPKHCCFLLGGPNHSLQSLGARGSSTVLRNRHGPLCVTRDHVPGTVLSPLAVLSLNEAESLSPGGSYTSCFTQTHAIQ